MPAFVAAETAWRMMTKRDPHGNIVRGTIAALGAAVGGADAVTVLPFSAALGAARRLRPPHRPQHADHPHRGGESPSRRRSGRGLRRHRGADRCALRAASWNLFQEIEREGGVADALEAGSIQNAVAKVRAEREANVARRKDTLIGTSDFPDLAEDKVAVLAQPRLASLSTQRSTALAAASGSRRALRALARPERCLSRASMARGRRCSSPVSAAPPISTRGRASPRACSSPAASRRCEGKRRQPRETIQGIRREACLPLLLGQGLCARGRSRRQGACRSRAPAASISPASPATTRRRWKQPALAASFTRAVIRLQILNAAYDEM